MEVLVRRRQIYKWPSCDCTYPCRRHAPQPCLRPCCRETGGRWPVLGSANGKDRVFCAAQNPRKGFPPCEASRARDLALHMSKATESLISKKNIPALSPGMRELSPTPSPPRDCSKLSGTGVREREEPRTPRRDSRDGWGDRKPTERSPAFESLCVVVVVANADTGISTCSG